MLPPGYQGQVSCQDQVVYQVPCEYLVRRPYLQVVTGIPVLRPRDGGSGCHDGDPWSDFDYRYFGKIATVLCNRSYVYVPVHRYVFPHK